MPTPVDFLRTVVLSGKNINNHKKQFDAIYNKIAQYYINEDIKREEELERRREELARLVARNELR
jgi:hypothetical protein